MAGFFKITIIMHLVFISECKNSSNYVKIHHKLIVKSFVRYFAFDFQVFSSNCNSEEIIHNSATNFTMTTLKDWNLENLYKCPNFFGELSEENAKDILREAFQNDGKTRFEGILLLKVRKFQNEIVLFSFSPKNQRFFFLFLP